MKVTILTILLITLTAVYSIPVEGVTEGTNNYISAKSNLEEITRKPQLYQEKENDLEPSEFHYPSLVIKYPYHGYHGYHGHHGYRGHHGYYRPYPHHWHGGIGWDPHYRGHWGGPGGYYGGGIGYDWSRMY